MPHLLVDAGTSSLMFRLTEGNNRLRSIIGKNVLEEYLIYLLKHSKQFDSYSREVEYRVRKQLIRSPDAMAFSHDKCILFDRKSFAPQIGIRYMSASAYQNANDRLTQNCIEIIKRCTEFSYYNPFPKKFLKNNLYCCIVVEHSSFIYLKDVYLGVSKQMGYEVGDDDYVWMCQHVIICSIEDIELLLMYENSIFDAIAKRNTGSIYDAWFVDRSEYQYDLADPYLTFQKEVEENAHKELQTIINKKDYRGEK